MLVSLKGLGKDQRDYMIITVLIRSTVVRVTYLHSGGSHATWSLYHCLLFVQGDETMSLCLRV